MRHKIKSSSGAIITEIEQAFRKQANEEGRKRQIGEDSQ
jgi:hypothetical protein